MNSVNSRIVKGSAVLCMCAVAQSLLFIFGFGISPDGNLLMTTVFSFPSIVGVIGSLILIRFYYQNRSEVNGNSRGILCLGVASSFLMCLIGLVLRIGRFDHF